MSFVIINTAVQVEPTLELCAAFTPQSPEHQRCRRPESPSSEACTTQRWDSCSVRCMDGKMNMEGRKKKNKERKKKGDLKLW